MRRLVFTIPLVLVAACACCGPPPMPKGPPPEYEDPPPPSWYEAGTPGPAAPVFETQPVPSPDAGP